MKQFTRNEFVKVLQKNGWVQEKRNTGNHLKFKKKGEWGNITLAANRDPECVITNRLIKQFRLKV